MGGRVAGFGSEEEGSGRAGGVREDVCVVGEIGGSGGLLRLSVFMGMWMWAIRCVNVHSDSSCGILAL